MAGAIAGTAGIAGLLSVGKGRACMLRVHSSMSVSSVGAVGRSNEEDGTGSVSPGLGYPIQGAVLRTYLVS